MIGSSKSVWGFDPRTIPGCQLWLDAADQNVMTLSGSSITQLRDKSGNGNHMVNNGTSPLYNSSLINSVGGIDCTNGGALISSGIQNSANISFAMVAVVKSGITNWGSFFTHGDRDYDFAVERQENTSSINFQTANDNSSCIITFTLDAPVLYFGTMTSGTSRFFESFSGGVNTIVTGTNSSTISLGSKIIRVGKSDNNNEPCNSFIGEIIYYNTVLTTIQRQQIEGYLAHKWGFTSMYSALPSIHPFSSIRPHLRTFQPIDVPGCQLWLDAADQGSMTLSGSSVTQWSDKSGNGYHMNTLAGSSSTYWSGTPEYPTIGTSINNLPTVNFKAQSGLKQATTLDGVKNLFWIGRIAAPDGSGGAPLYFLLGHDSAYDWCGGTYGGTFFGDVINSQPGIYNASASLFTNDPNAVTNATFLNVRMPSAPNVSLLSVSGITGTTRYQGICYDRDIHIGWCGDLAEVIVFNTALTTSQRQQIEGYLARKWGISATLPSPHSFKSFPPATSAHFSPTDITGCQLWLDAADSSAVTIATGVSQWNDKSGNSNNLTQSTTGSQPTYASSLITFANDKYLNIPATVLNNLPTWSLFFVINPISSSNWIMSRQRDGMDSYNILSMTLSSTTSGGVQSGSVGNLYWRSMNAGTQLGSSDSLTTSTLQTCSLTYDGTILYFYKNGELNQATTGSFAIQNQTSPNTYTLGALIYPSGIANPGVTNFRLGEMISYNTFLTNAQRERVEGYLAHKWGLLSSLYSKHPYRTLPPIFPPIIQYNIIATGGTIVSTVGTTYHVFRTSSSFVVRRSVTVNYLVVGGGGGGGDRHGGGGGAGGVLSGSWSASAGTYIITVGAGGQYGSTDEGGQVAYGTPNGSGTKGGDSLLSGTGISITAYGGGGGGSYDGNPSGTVGSGGGGGGQNLSGVAGTAGQGNAGGSGSNPGAGGGGGAGGAGVAANTGTGGIGTSSFSTHLLAVGYGTTFAVPTSPNTVISGGVAYIAGGGGGCAGTSPGPGGSGGLGGGGRGDWADTNITAGTPNTGGGGGGTRSHPDSLQTTGRNGGSGLVLVWY